MAVDAERQNQLLKLGKAGVGSEASFSNFKEWGEFKLKLFDLCKLKADPTEETKLSQGLPCLYILQDGALGQGSVSIQAEITLAEVQVCYFAQNEVASLLREL